MKSKCVLFVSLRPSDFIEMHRAINKLAGTHMNVSLLYVKYKAAEDSSILQIINRLRDENILTSYYIQRENKASKNSITEASKINNTQKKVSYLKGAITEILSQIGNYFKNYRLYKEILHTNKFDLVVLPEDIVGFITPVLIKAAHACNIPSMILPYTICDQNEAFQSLKKNKYYQSNRLINCYVSKLFKKWCMVRDGFSVVRMPGHHILAHYLTRITPPDPWMMNSGYANVIAIESEKMRHYYLSAGLPDSKLRVVGAIYDDELAAIALNKVKEREKIYSKLGLSNDKPMLLIGGCPDQTKGTPPKFEFDNISECMEYICEQIKPLQQRYHLVMRPHPNHLEIGEYFKNQKIIVTDLPTDKLIAVSDIYIAHASATIRWAIACGVPVINYDVFYFCFSDFSAVKGVVTVNSKQEFARTVRELNTSKIEKMKRALQIEKQDWAMLDGKSTERIINLINELCALDKVPRTTH